MTSGPGVASRPAPARPSGIAARSTIAWAQALTPDTLIKREGPFLRTLAILSSNRCFSRTGRAVAKPDDYAAALRRGLIVGWRKLGYGEADERTRKTAHQFDASINAHASFHVGEMREFLRVENVKIEMDMNGPLNDFICAEPS